MLRQHIQPACIHNTVHASPHWHLHTACGYKVRWWVQLCCILSHASALKRAYDRSTFDTRLLAHAQMLSFMWYFFIFLLVTRNQQAIIRRNSVHHCSAYGIFYEISSNAKIYDNKVWDMHLPIFISSSNNVEVYNNIVAWVCARELLISLVIFF